MYVHLYGLYGLVPGTRHLARYLVLVTKYLVNHTIAHNIALHKSYVCAKSVFGTYVHLRWGDGQIYFGIVLEINMLLQKWTP